MTNPPWAYVAGHRAMQRALGLHKLAAVPRATKQYRRALQMLLEGDTAFHGTTNQNLAPLLRTGKIVPGGQNAFSRPGTAEVYFGDKLPPADFASKSKPMIAVNRTRVLGAEGVGESVPRVIPGAAWMANSHTPSGAGMSVDYLVTPHEVPLQPKDTVVLPGGRPTAEMRERHLRAISGEQFAKALEELYPRARRYYGEAY